VLNLELLDMPQVMRMLDFLNGVTYSTDGDIKNVSKSTYIITSRNVDISGDE
jgi:FtsZ-interacting cell division protein YlmF